MTMEDDLRARGRACVWCYGVLIQCFVLTPFTLKNIFYFSPTHPSFFFFFFFNLLLLLLLNKKNDYMENFSLLSRKEERMNNSKTEKRVIDSPNNRPNMK